MHILIFFFNDTATTEIYTLSLHDALPICLPRDAAARRRYPDCRQGRVDRHRADQLRLRLEGVRRGRRELDRKSTRLNSSHANISYAVFCLKKKKKRSH